jgi:hypothetical protein
VTGVNYSAHVGVLVEAVKEQQGFRHVADIRIAATRTSPAVPSVYYEMSCRDKRKKSRAFGRFIKLAKKQMNC